MAAHQAPPSLDSPGKDTGVGCHFLLQCMKVKSESEVAQSCPTLRDPMDGSLPGSSVHRIFQARVLEWGTIAFSQSGHTYTQIYFCHMHTQPRTHTCTHTHTHTIKQARPSSRSAHSGYLWGVYLSWSFLGGTNHDQDKTQQQNLHLVSLVLFLLDKRRAPQLLRDCELVPLFIGYVSWRNTYSSNSG